MKEDIIEEIAKSAVDALMKGDWTAYQRRLRGIPAEQEALVLKRIDEMLQAASKTRSKSQKRP